MAKVLVLYYSAYGHIEAMANAVAEGVREAGAQVDIKRVPELVPEEVARKSHYRLDQPAPVAKIEDLANYDAVIVGAGTRFGRLNSQMVNFLDQAGGLGDGADRVPLREPLHRGREVVLRDERVGHEGQREDHHEAGVVDHLGRADTPRQRSGW